MERLMRHSDISLRTEGFSLLCESTKGVSDFQNEELRLLLLCVESSMDIQTPHFRYNLYQF